VAKKKSTTKKKTTTKKSTKKAPASKSAATSVKPSTKKTSKKKTKVSKAAPAKTKKTIKRPAAKAKAPAAVAPDPAPEVFTPPKKIKTHLGRKELNQYRNLLMERRAEILGDVESMSDEALKINDSSNLSNMPLHMADVGSDNYEQELMLGLVESERAMVVEINEALDRIDNRTYGVCIHTGKPIPKARLEITPWAKYSIEAARELERNGRL
jgi:RNA polymerase-binding transcription factor DksA